jgi:hypothetical protein
VYISRTGSSSSSRSSSVVVVIVLIAFVSVGHRLSTCPTGATVLPIKRLKLLVGRLKLRDAFSNECKIIARGCEQSIGGAIYKLLQVMLVPQSILASIQNSNRDRLSQPRTVR